jgi:hypothetical protein
VKIDRTPGARPETGVKQPRRIVERSALCNVTFT